MSWNSELLTEQANTLTQTTSERDPRAYSWGLFSWGDAPPAIGGGTGCFQWFDSREELLAFLTDYSPALYMSFEQEEEWIGFRDRLRAIAESFEDEPLRSLGTFNSVLKGLLQIDWIGGFEELCQGQESFCCKVRGWFRDPGDIDEAAIQASEAPIEPDELQDFCERLQEYGF